VEGIEKDEIETGERAVYQELECRTTRVNTDCEAEELRRAEPE
jgi:hypothetical protein